MTGGAEQRMENQIEPGQSLPLRYLPWVILYLDRILILNDRLYCDLNVKTVIQSR